MSGRQRPGEKGGEEEGKLREERGGDGRGRVRRGKEERKGDIRERRGEVEGKGEERRSQVCWSKERNEE